MSRQHYHDEDKIDKGKDIFVPRVPRSLKEHARRQHDPTKSSNKNILIVEMIPTDPFHNNLCDTTSGSFEKRKHAPSISSAISNYGYPIDGRYSDDQSETFDQTVDFYALEPTPIREEKDSILSVCNYGTADDNNQYYRPSKRMKTISLHESTMDASPYASKGVAQPLKQLHSDASGTTLTSRSTSSPLTKNGASSPFASLNVAWVTPCPLPSNYTPGPNDVICGRGKRIKEFPGNIAFKSTVQQALHKYSQAASRFEKTMIVSQIIEVVRDKGGSFIRSTALANEQTRKTGKLGRSPATLVSSAGNATWYEVGDAVAREKIGQAFRDCLDEMYKSSTKAKRRRQREQRVPSTNDVDDTSSVGNDKKSSADLDASDARSDKRPKGSSRVCSNGREAYSSSKTGLVSSSKNNNRIATAAHCLEDRDTACMVDVSQQTSRTHSSHHASALLNSEMERLVQNHESISSILDGVKVELERLSINQESIVMRSKQDKDDEESNVWKLFIESSWSILNEIKFDPEIERHAQKIAATASVPPMDDGSVDRNNKKVND